MLGAADDGTLLSKPVEPEVSVEESATDEAVEMLPLSTFASEPGEVADWGCIVRMRCIRSRGLNVRSPTRSMLSLALLLAASGKFRAVNVEGRNDSKIVWIRA